MIAHLHVSMTCRDSLARSHMARRRCITKLFHGQCVALSRRWLRLMTLNFKAPWYVILRTFLSLLLMLLGHPAFFLKLNGTLFVPHTRVWGWGWHSATCYWLLLMLGSGWSREKSRGESLRFIYSFQRYHTDAISSTCLWPLNKLRCSRCLLHLNCFWYQITIDNGVSGRHRIRITDDSTCINDRIWLLLLMMSISRWVCRRKYSRVPLASFRRRMLWSSLQGLVPSCF